jgi:hypothetical protein
LKTVLRTNSSEDILAGKLSIAVEDFLRVSGGSDGNSRRGQGKARYQGNFSSLERINS